MTDTQLAAEFEAAYATRSGVSVGWLRAQGRMVVACDCDYAGCEGWGSVPVRGGWEDEWRRLTGEPWIAAVDAAKEAK